MRNRLTDSSPCACDDRHLFLQSADAIPAVRLLLHIHEFRAAERLRVSEILALLV